MFSTMGRFLQRLRKDTAGNTLAIVGAALIPITAMIGSGLDVSRAYMAKSRLQSACDASSLAARRVMRSDDIDENGELSDRVKDTGEEFFMFNFQQGTYNTEDFTPEFSSPEAGIVRVEASTRIPTTVMKLFGFGSLPLNVSCDASLNFVNTDVVLVLDVTGSMACLPSDSDTACSSYANLAANIVNAGGNSFVTLKSGSRMHGLRDAVMALYDELAPVQAQLQSQGLRLRYGVVPYSSAVNVGNLVRGANANYITNTTDYQSRVANYNTAVYVANTPTPAGSTIQTYGSNISAANCIRYGNNQSFTGSSGLPSATSAGGPAPTSTTSYTYQALDWGGSTNISGTGNKQCRRTRTAATTTYTTRYAFTNWTFREVQGNNTSAFKAGTAVTIATNTGGSVPANAPTPRSYTIQQLPLVTSHVPTTVNTPALTTAPSTWNGCIEERDTVSSIVAGGSLTIPPGAHDLNINLIPNSDATRWRPMWPELAARRTPVASSSSTTGEQMSALSNPAFTACPRAASRLQEWDRDDMQTEVDGLLAIGGTYHDIGMIWGARMISSSGIFADSPDTFNEMPVNRHIIFMTDGQLAANTNSLTSYGIEQHDTRVANSTSVTQAQLTARHLQRFRMICNATKGQNVSIWVIAFGTTLQPEMIECASNSSQAERATNRDELIERFRRIGNQIGALRLTK